MRVPLGGDGVKTVKVRRSDGVSECVVRCLPGGVWTATCEGFVYCGTCRHIKKVRRRLAADVPVPGERL